MTTQFSSWQLRLLCCGSFTLLLGAIPAFAQITPDRTLPNASVVNRNQRNTIITGGTRAGTNLFHSFREFSVSSGDTASFRQIASDIKNIFARVTGGGISHIDGTIEALQANGQLSSANLFLLNPNGILFGPNASLNLGGSFIATTANRINFADGQTFSTTNSESPVLTISVPTGLQFGSNPGRISNQSALIAQDSAGNPVLDASGEVIPLGLSVPAGRTLALIGGDVVLKNGALSVFGEPTSGLGERIELGSVESPSQVSFTPVEQGWQFDYSQVRRFGDIRLSGASVRTSNASSGTIQFRGNRVGINDSTVFADTYTGNTSQGIELQASQINLANAFVTAETYSSGNGGKIQIGANQLNLDSSQISTGTSADGNAGSIQANIAQLNLINGAQIVAFTRSSGQGGRLEINASDSVDLIGSAGDNNSLRSSLLSAQGDADTATGNAGHVVVSTGRLRLLQGGQISADNLGSGSVGIIRIYASDIELADVARSPEGNPFLNSVGVPEAPSSISAFAYPNSSGGGNIDIHTQRLELRDGATIQITTQGSGDAGNLRIRAADFLKLSGTAEGGREAPTGLLTFSGGIPGTIYDNIGGNINSAEATGRGGDLQISTGNLIVQDRAVIAVGSLSPSSNAKGAGNLSIDARTIRLADQGNLLAATASKNGGNMNLQVQDLLLLSGNSNISTTAGIAQQDGNGGEINIDAGLIVASPSQNNDITANAFTGNGGNIDITAQGILGINSSESNTPLSDITASSELGVNGTIQFNVPNIDPSQGLVELPSTVVDASNLIAQACPTGNADTHRLGRFVITGRGGLPPSPSDSRDEQVLTGWAELESSQAQDQSQQSAVREEVPLSKGIVEAQGWRRDDQGQVWLVGQLPSLTPQAPVIEPKGCHSEAEQ